MAEVTLGALSDTGTLIIGDGYRTKRAEHGQPGYRILRVADVADGHITLDGDDFVHMDYHRAIGAKLSQPGDVLLTTKGTVGRVAIYPQCAEQVVYSPQLCFFRVNDSSVLNPRYLAYWFKSESFDRQASHRANNTDMAAYINLRDIRSLQLSLPCIEEQQAIAELLGALDDKIAANDRAYELLDRLCAAHVRKATLQGERKSLRDVLVLNYGKSLPATLRTPGNVAVYGSGGLTGTHATALVDRPGVVVGRKGTVGAVYWADRPHFPIDTTYSVKPIGTGMDEILYYVLRSTPLDQLNSDSAVPGLNRDEAYAVQVQMPAENVSAALSEMLRIHFAWMSSVREESQQLARVRDELLPLFVSGKVRMWNAQKLVKEVVDDTTTWRQ